MYIGVLDVLVAMEVGSVNDRDVMILVDRQEVAHIILYRLVSHKEPSFSGHDVGGNKEGGER
jgi:hypothetical protein